MNKALLACCALIAVILFASLALIYERHKEPAFAPVGVECFDQFMSIVQSGYADPGLDLPPFDLKDISEFRCASKKGFEQYEITGIDTRGHSFYVHHNGGGIAASGADSLLDHCYKSDGIVVKSIRLSGRDSLAKEGSCKFDEDFLADPESKYTFTSKRVHGDILYL